MSSDPNVDKVQEILPDCQISHKELAKPKDPNLLVEVVIYDADWRELSIIECLYRQAPEALARWTQTYRKNNPSFGGILNFMCRSKKRGKPTSSES